MAVTSRGPSPVSAPPVASPAAPAGFESPITLARFERLEKDMFHHKRNLKLVQNTNWLIVIVLFVGFLAMLITGTASMIQTFKSDTDSRTELIKTIEQLNTKLENQKNQETPAPTAPSTTPTQE